MAIYAMKNAASPTAAVNSSGAGLSIAVVPDDEVALADAAEAAEAREEEAEAASEDADEAIDATTDDAPAMDAETEADDAAAALVDAILADV